MSPTQTRRSTTPHEPELQISLNGLAKRIKRVAFGMTNFRNCRIRVLLSAGKPNWSKLATVTP